MRGLSITGQGGRFVDLRLEFEGRRAYVVWDAIRWKGYELKVRLEVNRKLLQKADAEPYDYYYRGKLVLPRAEDN
jgi:hypothetical protein